MANNTTEDQNDILNQPPSLTLIWNQHEMVTIHINPNPEDLHLRVRIWFFPGIVTKERVELDMGRPAPVNWVFALSWDGWVADISSSQYIHRLNTPLPHSVSYWAQWLDQRGRVGTLGDPVTVTCLA